MFVCAKLHESSTFSLDLGDYCRLIFQHAHLDHVFGSYLGNLYELHQFLFVAYTLAPTKSKSSVVLFCQQHELILRK